MNKTICEHLEEEKVTTMVLEIDLTKCKKTYNEVMELISSLEQQDLSENDLEIKKICFK